MEALGYHIILYAPAYIFPRLPALSFLLYMAVMGLAGVADHSGVRLRALGGVYDSGEHDEHHRLVNCNYAFPVAWMDRLCGTYVPPREVEE
mmetsp:Transcript_26363/g.66003  ORF Transcript_26363/g.66003 Transcript_26363/m.66003 type:complete len:91 (+) Transcript_26363:101-373(+)